VNLDGAILTEAGYTPNIEVPWHYHENAYFFYHLRGRLDEVNKRKTITCTPGTLLFHHWQDPHFDKNFSADASFFHIEIDNKWFLRHQLKAGVLEGSWEIQNPIFKPIFQKIHREIRYNDTATQISVDGLLLQAIAEITRESFQQRTAAPLWVLKVKEILNDRLNTRITLSDLSTETGVHPVHLSKNFPRYFGTGFGQYIRNARVQKACKLLVNENSDLSQIAYECGFSDQSHFIRCFKDIIGTTPSAYLREHQ
jgi:AraC family transcriptional regulator